MLFQKQHFNRAQSADEKDETVSDSGQTTSRDCLVIWFLSLGGRLLTPVQKEFRDSLILRGCQIVFGAVFIRRRLGPSVSLGRVQVKRKAVVRLPLLPQGPY